MANGFLELQQLEDFFKTGWANLTPVKWPNVGFDQPSSIYVVYSITTGDGDRAALGPTYFERHNGIVNITAIAPADTGTRDAAIKCDVAAGIFREKTVTIGDSTFTFFTPVCRQVGLIEGKWQHNMACPFWREQLFT